MGRPLRPAARGPYPPMGPARPPAGRPHCMFPCSFFILSSCDDSS